MIQAIITRTSAGFGDRSVVDVSYVEFSPQDFNEFVSHLEPDDGLDETGFQYTGRDTDGSELTVRVVRRPSIYVKGESLPTKFSIVV